MTTAVFTKWLAETSPRQRNKVVAVYYLLTILTGVFVLFFHGHLALAADLVVAGFYLAVTALFYGLSKSTNFGPRT